MRHGRHVGCCTEPDVYALFSGKSSCSQTSKYGQEKAKKTLASFTRHDSRYIFYTSANAKSISPGYRSDDVNRGIPPLETGRTYGSTTVKRWSRSLQLHNNEPSYPKMGDQISTVSRIGTRDGVSLAYLSSILLVKFIPA